MNAIDNQVSDEVWCQIKNQKWNNFVTTNTWNIMWNKVWYQVWQPVYIQVQYQIYNDIKK